MLEPPGVRVLLAKGVALVPRSLWGDPETIHYFNVYPAHPQGALTSDAGGGCQGRVVLLLP